MNHVDPVAFAEYMVKKAYVAEATVPKVKKGLQPSLNDTEGAVNSLSNLKQNKMAAVDPVAMAERMVVEMNNEFYKMAAAAVPMQGVQGGPPQQQQQQGPQTAVPLTQAQQDQKSEQDLSMHVARLQNLSPDGGNLDPSMYESSAALYAEVDDNQNHPAYALLQQALPVLGMGVGLDLSDPGQASIFDKKMGEMSKGLMQSGPAESASWRSILADQNRLAGFFTQQGNGKK